MNTLNKAPYRKPTQDPSLNPRKSVDYKSSGGLNLESPFRSPVKSVYYDFESMHADSAGKERLLKAMSPGIDEVEDPEQDVVMEKEAQNHKCCGGCNMF